MNIGITYAIFITMNIMYRFLELYNYVPLRKCGAAAGIGAIIGGVGAVTSGIGGLISSDDAVDTNVEENEKNRKFNAEEAQKQRDWASEEWQHQFNEQSQQWYEQQDYANQQSYDYWMKQQEYNSPVEQNRRLLQAGLNPAHIVGSTVYGSTGLSAAPVSVPNPSVPSGSAASVSTSNPVSAVDKASAFERAASGLTKIVDAIGSFSKNTAEADSTRAQLQPILDNWLLKNTNQELLNSYQEMYNIFFDKKAPKELKLLGEKINNVIADTIVKQVSGELVEEQTITEQFKQILMDKDIRLRGEQYLQAVAITHNIETQLKLQNRLFEEQAKTEKSKQAENYASAEDSHERAVTEREFRPVRESILKIQKDLDERTVDYKVRDWWQKTQFNEQRIFLDAIRLRDMSAYNAFQRVILGHGSEKDKKTVIDLIRGLSDADKLSGAIPY